MWEELEGDLKKAQKAIHAIELDTLGLSEQVKELRDEACQD